jgi:hypothetical protein
VPWPFGSWGKSNSRQSYVARRYKLLGNELGYLHRLGRESLPGGAFCPFFRGSDGENALERLDFRVYAGFFII